MAEFLIGLGAAGLTLLAFLWLRLRSALGRLEQERRRAEDLSRANETRRRAQAVQEKHRETAPRIDDDALDRRLRELREPR